MVARDIMTKKVITVTPLTSVKELAKIMSKSKISRTPVIDKKGKLLGVVSEADIVAKRGTQVKGIMSKKAISVTDETPC